MEEEAVVEELDRMKNFKKIKVYFSNTITGVPDIKRQFGWHLVSYMKSLGCEVLDDFVGARSKAEHIKMFLAKTGFDRSKVPNPWFFVRKNDISSVDEATHLVAVINGASFGVGMELQRAIDKPRLGLNQTPILCLIHKDLLENLSFMVRGISDKENAKFEIKTYRTLNDSKKAIRDFFIKYS